MPATLTKRDDSLVLDLSTARGAEFKEALEKIRQVPGRRYDPETKMWSVEATATNADRILHSIQPTASDDLRDWVRRERTRATVELTTPMPADAEIKHPLGSTLYPYQRAFVDLAVRKRKIVNADDMGLGKTLQALAVVAEYQQRNATSDGDTVQRPDGPKLIVCPNSVKGVWAREIVKWLGSETPHQIIDGSTLESRHKQLLTAIQENAYCIVNYEQLRVKTVKYEVTHKNGRTTKRKLEVLKEPLFELPFLAAANVSLDDLEPRVIMRARTSKHRTNWLALIGDEVHRAKNRRALQTKGLHRTQGTLMLGQTGTPLMNTPDELWSILHWLWPEQYTSFHNFYETYVEYTEGYFGKIITGVRNPDALRYELKERLVRRTKKEVLKDLPDKTRVTVPVTLTPSERKFYDEVLAQVWVDLKGAAEGNDVLAQAMNKGDLSGLLKIPNGAARLVRLQQVLEHPANIAPERPTEESAKLNAIQEIVLDSGKPQVVFFKFKNTVSIFAERLRAAGKTVGVYTGDTDPSARTRLEDEFQRGEIDCMVGTLDAMREGITLTAASECHFGTLSWTPAWNEQAEDRLHRNGQKDSVTIYRYEVQNTIDDGKVVPANRTKEAIVSTVLKKDDIKENRK